jgi:hypothetical protein
LLLFSGPSFIFLPKYNADFASLGLFKQLWRWFIYAYLCLSLFVLLGMFK